MNTWTNQSINEQAARALAELEGLRIDPNRLEAQPGFPSTSGGFGTVTVAKLDKNLLRSRRFASQEISQIVLGLRAFARELKVWAPLHHPNLLKLSAFSLTSDMFNAYFITPYHPYGDVGRYIDRTQPDQRARYGLAADTAYGLRHLHEKRIVHGDLKFGNVLVSSQGRALLCDFGLAKMIDEDGQPSGLTTSKMPLSVRYASPELIDGSPRHFQSDIWAWGCLFLQILSDINAYEDAQTDIRCVLKIMNGIPPANPSVLNLVASFQNMLSLCWDLDPSRRPSIAKCLEVIESEQSHQNQSASSQAGPRIWDTAAGVLVTRKLDIHTAYVETIAFSPDGKLIASGSGDFTARIWEPSSGALVVTLEGHSSKLWKVAFSPDGKCFASASRDKTVKLWSTSSWDLIANLTEHLGPVTTIAFSPNSTRLVSGSNHTVQVWDASSGVPMEILKGHTSWINVVAFSPDGNHIVSGSGDATARVWEGTSATLSVILRGHTYSISSVAFSLDGLKLATAASNGDIRVWGTGNWELTGVLEGHTSYVSSVVFAPDGKRLFSGSGDMTVRTWNIETGALLAVLKGHTGMIDTIALSPDGLWLASASSEGMTRIWDATSGASAAIMRDQSDRVTCITFSPDGTRLAAGSDDKTVQIWDARILDATATKM